MRYIWWTKMTSSSRFLDSITDAVRDGQSLILQIPKNVPWYNTMFEIVSSRIRTENGDMELVEVNDDGRDPGALLLNDFCKKEKRAQYRPGIGYAKYLAESDDIILNTQIIWVRCADLEQIDKWCTFIVDYNRLLGKDKQGCVIIVETFEEDKYKGKKGVKKIDYSSQIVDYDYYLFNLMVASEIKGTEYLRTYLAEAVRQMYPGDVELSAKCIKMGKTFLDNPFTVLQDIIDNSFRSNGAKFETSLAESQINACLWEAQIKVIYPLIEKHRNRFIEKYATELDAVLPVNNSYNEEITDARQLEIGTIAHLVFTKRVKLVSEDEEKISVLKNARNKLSHINCMNQNMVENVLKLDLNW